MVRRSRSGKAKLEDAERQLAIDGDARRPLDLIRDIRR
jgi:hypothetical protein